MLKSEADLYEVVQDFFLRKVPVLSLPDSNHVSQCSPICVLHHQVHAKLLVSENIVKLNYVVMVQGGQDIRLESRNFSLFVRDWIEVDLLDDPELVSQF